MTNFIQETKKRWTAESPEYFAKISKLSIRLILSSMALLGIPFIIDGVFSSIGSPLGVTFSIKEYLPEWYTYIGTHGIIIGIVMYVLSKLTAKDPNILHSFSTDITSQVNQKETIQQDNSGTVIQKITETTSEIKTTVS